MNSNTLPKREGVLLFLLGWVRGITKAFVNKRELLYLDGSVYKYMKMHFSSITDSLITSSAGRPLIHAFSSPNRPAMFIFIMWYYSSMLRSNAFNSALWLRGLDAISLTSERGEVLPSGGIVVSYDDNNPRTLQLTIPIKDPETSTYDYIGNRYFVIYDD